MLVKCFCTNCAGHLEFEEQNAGEEIPCPHCGFRTTLFLPGTQAPDAEIVTLITKRARRRRAFVLAGSVVAALVIVVLIWIWVLPWVQQLLGGEVSRWVALLALVLGCLLVTPALLWLWFWLLFPFLVFIQLEQISQRLGQIVGKISRAGDTQSDQAEGSQEGQD